MIALIGKSDGGLRPIGLFMTTVRLWMRVRSQNAKKWENEHARSNVYGGKSMGAQRAAWQSTFQAEASALRPNNHYAQTLLDVVKAFEKVRHDLLIDAAWRHGYDMVVLRMCLRAYRAPRTISINGVSSRMIVATCGITAGAGMATVELRLLFLDMVDDSYRIFQNMSFLFYVDDVTIECWVGWTM